MPLDFSGVHTAIVTPFQADGSVDHDALSALVERQVAAGLSGIVPCGTTGESPTLTAKEKEEVIATCVKVAAKRILGSLF